MRFAPFEDTMTKPSVPVRPEKNTAIPAADDQRTCAACGHNDHRRQYRRRRQQYGQAERVHHYPDGKPSRLRRRCNRTHANRYQTEYN